MIEFDQWPRDINSIYCSLRQRSEMDGCYANLLGSCTGPLSIEHIFSKSVFATHRVLEVIGLAKPNDGFYPIKSLGSRILCKRHNELLSPVDGEAKALSGALNEFRDSGQSRSVSVNGKLLERYLLKVVVGSLVSGTSTTGKMMPSKSILDVLFGFSEPPSPYGLHTFEPVMRESVGEEIFIKEYVAFHPDVGRTVVAAVVGLHGIPFLLSICGPSAQEVLDGAVEHSDLGPFRTTKPIARFRPSNVSVKGEDPAAEFRIELLW